MVSVIYLAPGAELKDPSDLCDGHGLAARSLVLTAQPLRDGSRGNAERLAQAWALIDVGYPDARTVRVVLDNLGTHTPMGALQRLPG